MNISEADNFDFDIEGKKHKQIFDFILSCFIEDNSPTFVAEYNEVLNNILVSIDDEPFFTIHVEYVGKFYDSKSKISLNPYAPKNMHKQSIIVKDFSSEEQLRVIMLINEIKQESIGYDIRRPTLSTENKILSLVLEELRKNKSVSAYEYDDIQEKVLVYIDNKICFSISLSWDGTPPSKRKYFLSTKPYYSIKSHKITNDLSKDYTYLGCEITNQTQDVINHFIDLQVNNVIFLLDKMKKEEPLVIKIINNYIENINNYIKDIDGAMYDSSNNTVLYKGEYLKIKINDGKICTYISLGESNIIDDNPNLIELKDAIYIIDKIK